MRSVNFVFIVVHGFSVPALLVDALHSTSRSSFLDLSTSVADGSRRNATQAQSASTPLNTSVVNFNNVSQAESVMSGGAVRPSFIPHDDGTSKRMASIPIRLKVVYVNVDTSVDRKRCMDAQMAGNRARALQAGFLLSVERFSAVIFEKCTDSASCKVEKPECFPSGLTGLFTSTHQSPGGYQDPEHQVSVLRGVLGNYCSHMKILQNLERVTAEYDLFMILEDDAIFKDTFFSELAGFVQKNSKYWSLVAVDTFSAPEKPLPVSDLVSPQVYSISSIQNMYWGAHAWMLNPAYLENVLKYYETLPAMAVDWMPLMRRPLHMSFWAFQPNAVKQRARLAEDEMDWVIPECTAGSIEMSDIEDAGAARLSQSQFPPMPLLLGKPFGMPPTAASNNAAPEIAQLAGMPSTLIPSNQADPATDQPATVHMASTSGNQTASHTTQLIATPTQITTKAAQSHLFLPFEAVPVHPEIVPNSTNATHRYTGEAQPTVVHRSLAAQHPINKELEELLHPDDSGIKDQPEGFVPIVPMHNITDRFAGAVAGRASSPLSRTQQGKKVVLLGMHGSGLRMVSSLLAPSFGISDEDADKLFGCSWKGDEAGHCGKIWMQTHPQRLAEYAESEDGEFSDTVAVAVVRHPFSLLGNVLDGVYYLKCDESTKMSRLLNPCTYSTPVDNWADRSAGSPSLPRAVCHQAQQDNGGCWVSAADAWLSYSRGYELLKCNGLFHDVLIVRFEDVIQHPEAIAESIAVAAGMQLTSRRQLSPRKRQQLKPLREKLKTMASGTRFTCPELEVLCNKLQRPLMASLGYHGCEKGWAGYHYLVHRMNVSEDNMRDVMNAMRHWPDALDCWEPPNSSWPASSDREDD